jgi:hypothetical protein
MAQAAAAIIKIPARRVLEILSLSFLVKKNINRRISNGKSIQVSRIKKITFIDKGIMGEAAKACGKKYYDVLCDICWENVNEYEELGDLHFTMEQEILDKFLLSKKMTYDKEKREFEII